MKRKISLLTALVMALALSGCGIGEVKDTINEKVDEKIEQHAAEKCELTQEEVDEKVYATLAEGKKTIEFDGVVSTEMLQQSVNSTRYACPEIFWTGGFSVITDYSKTTLECDSIHDLSEDELGEMVKELDDISSQIANEAAAYDSDFDKLRYLHDTLIDMCDYDYDAYASNDPEVIGFAGSAYGCMVERKAVCEGYAKAFALAARKMGFDCGIVCGAAKDEQHAWNYVKADGEYYWLDVTWDENATEQAEGFCPRYKFFMLDDERFMADRSKEDDVPFMPECSSMDDNYYVHNGLYLESYDFDTFNALLNEHAAEGGLDIMFSNRESYDAAISELMENGKIWLTDCMQGAAEASPYYADDDLLILTVPI